MSQWYVAHILLTMTLVEGELDYLPMWENIYIIKAENSDEAFLKADKIGEEEQAASDGTTFDGKPSFWKYRGVRRMAECLEDLDQLESGMELTYLQYTVGSEEALDGMLNHKPILLVLEDKEHGEEDDYHPQLLSPSRVDQ